MSKNHKLEYLPVTCGLSPIISENTFRNILLPVNKFLLNSDNEESIEDQNNLLRPLYGIESLPRCTDGSFPMFKRNDPCRNNKLINLFKYNYNQEFFQNIRQPVSDLQFSAIKIKRRRMDTFKNLPQARYSLDKAKSIYRRSRRSRKSEQDVLSFVSPEEEPIETTQELKKALIKEKTKLDKPNKSPTETVRFKEISKELEELQNKIAVGIIEAQKRSKERLRGKPKEELISMLAEEELRQKGQTGDSDTTRQIRNELEKIEDEERQEQLKMSETKTKEETDQEERMSLLIPTYEKKIEYEFYNVEDFKDMTLDELRKNVPYLDFEIMRTGVSKLKRKNPEVYREYEERKKLDKKVKENYEEWLPIYKKRVTDEEEKLLPNRGADKLIAEKKETGEQMKMKEVEISDEKYNIDTSIYNEQDYEIMTIFQLEIVQPKLGDFDTQDKFNKKTRTWDNVYGEKTGTKRSETKHTSEQSNTRQRGRDIRHSRETFGYKYHFYNNDVNIINKKDYKHLYYKYKSKYLLLKKNKI